MFIWFVILFLKRYHRTISGVHANDPDAHPGGAARRLRRRGRLDVPVLMAYAETRMRTVGRRKIVQAGSYLAARRELFNLLHPRCQIGNEPHPVSCVLAFENPDCFVWL